MPRVRQIFLWLFVLNLGIAFGAGLYEAAIEFPNWLVKTGETYTWNAEAARAANSGLRFWTFVTTGPLTLLTLINLALSWKAEPALRRWWLGGTLVCLAERVLTFTYFIPGMIALLESPSTSESVARAMAWGNMNCLRHLLAGTAWLVILQAFAIFHGMYSKRAAR